jgi:membrane-associated phospholipid phosphatase
MALILMTMTATTVAQEPGDAPQSKPKSINSVSASNEKLFFRHLVEDQRNIWLSPTRIRAKDAEWLLPLAGITTSLILTDRTTEPEIARQHPDTALKFSNIGLAAYAGGVAGFYLYGRSHGSPRLRETGVLATEAAINSLIVGEALKFAFLRDRPGEGDGTGPFFRSGGSSFYSVHSTISWSFASVIAHEYPGWLSKTLAYGAASTISFSRVAAAKHFPSDVFVGAVAGYLIGSQVYTKRHDPDIDAAYGTFGKQHPKWSSRNAGSSYVPLDNWVYPALERLIAYGYVRYQFLGLRPWTRTAIADMLAEANERMQADGKVSPEIQSTFRTLSREFAVEAGIADTANKAIRLESLYERTTVISGQPLNDSFHFGQTIINDFGRPYQRGLNQIAGFTARAEQGRFAYYVRGEYQHASSAPGYPLSVRQVIANVDSNPVQPATPFGEVNTFRLLDAYASMTLAGNDISVGKQNYWWNTGNGGAMIMSNNAESFYSVRINRTIPFRLPWIFKYLGPMRYDGFFGQLYGHQFPPRPFMHGEKISLKPTENLEFGFSRTAVFAGEGVTPLTFGTFWNSLTSTTSSTGPGASLRNSPGARHGQFDFSYRLPWLRKWVTLYTDSLVHDDVSPIDAPRRAAISPGIYISHFPKLAKLDLRVEAVNTDPPITNSVGGRFFYWEGIYHDLYLNKRYLMGNWIGREGKGVQVWSTYWLSPFSTIQFSYRNAKVAKDFIPEGETSNSYAMQAKLRLIPDVEVIGKVQFERWKAPVLDTSPQTDVTTSIQVTFWPKRLKVSSQ